MSSWNRTSILSPSAEATWPLPTIHRLCATGVVAALVAVLAVPAEAFHPQEITDSERRQLTADFSLSISRLKGPFGENTCVCTDGRQAPVRAPNGEIRNICGAQTLFCAAFRAEWADRLAKQRVYIANIFSRDLYLWDSFPDHHDLVRGYILERFFIDTHPDHKLAKLRAYGGLSGSEYEAPASRRFFERYLTMPSFNDFRHFLLAFELQKRFLVRGDVGTIQEVRSLATRIQSRDPEFKPLRDATHNQVSSALLPKLAAYRDAQAPGEIRSMVDQLIREIDRLTSLGEEAMTPLLREIEDAEARDMLSALLGGAKDEPGDAIASVAEMMVSARRLVATGGVSPADARRLIDLNVIATAVLQSRGSALLESGKLKTVEQHIRLLAALTDATYGVGLLSARELEAASDNLAGVLSSPTMDRKELLVRLGRAERIVEWAQTGALLAFSEVSAPWLLLMPDVVMITDDILRGSPLLLFARVDERLRDQVSGQAAVQHLIFGASVEKDLRALNPGLAMGRLRLNPKQGSYSRDEVLALSSTPAELQPTAGILTQGEGNVVSHVQLLARALGIPNAVTNAATLELVAEHDGRDVFYVVTPGGRVILKEVAAMTEEDRVVLEEYTRNVERTSDGELVRGGGGKLVIDRDRIDLGATLPVDLASLRRSDSGVRVGPKAAFLGELKHMFPDKVARGVVVPFGAYYEHCQRTRVAIPPELEASGLAEKGEPLADFVKRTYELFFGKMIPGGMAEQELSAWIRPRLALIRHSIRHQPLDPLLERAIQDQLDRQGLLLARDKTQTVGCFVRSDTNVEDLENFNGAGLNLTIFNLKSLDDIEEGLKQVWASPFTYRSFSWRQTLIDDPLWVLPSVVILESVPSEKSGVAVTADINQGDPDKILLATSEGVGGAVDGTPAETLLWSREGVELVAMFKSPKRKMLRPEGGGEIVAATGEEYVLSDQELDAITAAALEIEKKLEPTLDAKGRPRPWDIEYGFSDGHLWLFQVRPFIGSEEVANLPALAIFDSSRTAVKGSVSLEEVVK